MPYNSDRLCARVFFLVNRFGNSFISILEEDLCREASILLVVSHDITRLNLFLLQPFSLYGRAIDLFATKIAKVILGCEIQQAHRQIAAIWREIRCGVARGGEGGAK